MNLIDFAHDILDMQTEIEDLRRENARLAEVERKYLDLLDASIERSNAAMASMLDVLMTPGVTDALALKETTQ